ncbi:MAG TPA: DedA family protein [Blastocatellia bacterium]|jgi:membrane protein DedA with SNARE-associated domain|nr:DedA family protein [Blastocatellia bacterium]
MDIMEQAYIWFQSLSPVVVLAMMFLIAYVENIFPPAPSDLLLVIAGTLIGSGKISFAPALTMATMGSVLGFMTAYVFGRYFEQHFVSGRYHRYLPVNGIHQVERLFNRFGYGVIVANRFLAGTRAIVSFFAGMSKMNLLATSLLSAVSAAIWNSILLYLGVFFAGNYRVAERYLAAYSKIATVVFGAAVVFFLWRYFRNRRRNADSQLANDQIGTTPPVEIENQDQVVSDKNQSPIIPKQGPQSAIE